MAADGIVSQRFFPSAAHHITGGRVMPQVQTSSKGVKFINVQITDPSPQGWLGHKPAYKEKEGKKEIDFEKTPVLSITQLQAEKMIRRGQAREYKAKKKRAPSNKMVTGAANK